MTPPRRGSGKGRGRGSRGSDRDRSSSINSHGDESSNAKPKKRERGNSSNKRGGGRGGGAPSATLSLSATSARPTRAVTTVLKKLVVRNIPSTVSEEQARELLQAHGVSDEHICRFVPSRKRSNNRPPTPARLYVDLKNEPSSARKLIALLHGHIFFPEAKDQGDTTPLDVEFAPFQKVPREKTRSDAKAGMIDRHPEYLAFLEELAKPQDKLPSAEALVDMADSETVEKPVPALVKYLNERKAHSRDKGKGKAGAKLLDKSGRRSKGKKDGLKQKVSKDKEKSIKERQKKKSGDVGGNFDSKTRKQRGKVSILKDLPEASKTEPSQPGSVHIMTLKSATATSSAKMMMGTLVEDIVSDCKVKLRGPTSGKKSGGRGRNLSKKGKDGGEKAENPSTRLLPRRKGIYGGKDSFDKTERKKKVFAPKDATAQGTPAKS